MKKKLLIALVLCLTYFLFGLYTLKDYNISWDEPTHFKRGQAYLWYFLTGEKSYQSLPPYNLFAAQTDPNYHTRSFYQNDTHNYSFWLTSAGGDHPPLNGILASLSNYIFYQKLGWIGDVEAYHLFGIFVSSLLVGTVFLFASKFNFWVGIYSVIFLATYPLFWGESHFNVKDPIETSFFALTIYFFWKSIVYKKSSQLFLSVLFAGLALSTKFNILFVSFIIGLWLLIRQFFLKLPTFQVIRSKRFIFILLIAPVIILSILILSWPYLWPNIPRNLLEVLKYYEGIGTEESFSNDYILGQWNFYALKWIILTTLPILLGAFVIGLISFLKWSKEKKDLLILWGLWFFVTIIRVTLPNMSIYGGVRQIMEYIPAMALIGGVGIYFIQQILNDAQTAYEQAVKLDPNDLESQTEIYKIRNLKKDLSIRK